MKKIKIALLVFVIVINSIGCNSSRPEKNRIVGKWKVDKAYKYRSKETTVGVLEKREDEILTKEVAGTTYNFSADGIVTIVAGYELNIPEKMRLPPKTGNWEMGKDEKNGNAELSMIIMKGKYWEETWMPGVGKSLFYMEELDYINANLMYLGSSVVFELSKSN